MHTEVGSVNDSSPVISLLEIWWILQECTTCTWFGCIQTNVPKPNSAIVLSPPYLKIVHTFQHDHKMAVASLITFLDKLKKATRYTP